MGVDFACVEVPFDEIIPAVVAGKYRGQKIDAGLIIHEGQLTYGEQDLKLVVDLGVWWKERTGLPLPLGANGDPQVTRAGGDLTKFSGCSTRASSTASPIAGRR